MEAAEADFRPPEAQSWAGRIKGELAGNILPFWPRYVLDREGGGFFGEVGPDLSIRKQAPRASVLNTRLLWTYATAAREISPEWRPIADWAFEYVRKNFWDPQHGGLFWQLDGKGAPLDPRKQTYAQAFGIYALAEYHRLTGDAAPLELAKRLYLLIEQHAFDPEFGGYIEARGRAFEPLADMRLSEKDLNSPKSMNTHLHVLEGYTNLLRVWPDPGLKEKQKALITVMLDRIADAETGHFKLFFDERWASLNDHVSFGHDIEGSWLLWEAAEVLGDAALIERVRIVAIKMARVALAEGLDADGSMLFDADTTGRLLDVKKHWWVQAEAVVGFYNAYQLTGEEAFRAASFKAWEFIEHHVVDRVHGEWHAKLSREGVALTEAEDPDSVLAGPWKCPYHNARVCYEMLNRLMPNILGRSENKTP
ncbi:mannobiose 2-epimerase [Rhizomicrobium palustre]|uniref:Cellobiose 2-epimerase n=1 Tax=Rhizomicrobium palustre TaxID=189966 RepID=A0A846MZP0_9PROT|nr:AGE family epimerase/isomerase [Rhizomicrobium palustre]NIK88407.1 mannobiose 2-epimerase [Rhizomicrobium palustre]